MALRINIPVSLSRHKTNKFNSLVGHDYTGCGRNSELNINKNNILLKVIDTNSSTSQFTMVLNFFFYIVSLFV